ncbi:hypothetical protein [Rubrivivax benzoatilyticus]|uniref:Uncharacterized protein n=1 Tax=Rubrivivax benzoatilyticus TaxID=316997 RepID=A0ABX0HWU5_9BURK|nr:hypothetical protein [Rubrivivax benzoatilyticus]NHK99482.1 hypothetical protein [Rubrivivax benzoatilyticus]NHL25356.1 hypothetical protein [Rubrivivax benzoatilyticus]
MTETTAVIVYEHGGRKTVSFTTPEGIHALFPADLTPQVAGDFARQLERSLRRRERRVAKRSRTNPKLTGTY